ncbi:TonB-dependent receptor [uncultured Planktosalinus sp.]|uniref:TonB-dependent receptor n=1 Tax=uncultured Planktosalinus sp. TaxID=1810935 RepID=UPI0030D7E71F
MSNKHLFSILFCLLSTLYVFSQSGKISGTVYDGEYNDVLPFATISVKGASNGTTSDFEGDYSLDLEEGVYTIVFSFVGYETKEIQEVSISNGNVFEMDVTLNASTGILDEVVISTTVRRNTEESVLNLQKNSATLMDGLSSQSISRSGASSIASAVKSVPGVSVQEGKYLYVRGLGDRYTKSILNGMDIPGLDPDKNTIQMDIFPTNILENIIIYKSASAELPADFTGGVVDIVTKDFPSKKQMSVSFSAGYNPDMHFNNNYLSQEGGNTDFLGFDDGTRELPISSQINIPNPAESNSNLETITRLFDPNMAAQRESSLMDFSFGFNYGNQFEFNKNKLGFIASIDYKNATTFYEGFENGVYQKPEERDSYELRFDRRQFGDVGQNNVLASIMTGLSFKTAKSKYTLNLLHIQNGESRAALFNQNTEISNDINTVKDNLEYTQRSVTNLLFGGKHTSGDGSFITDWKISPTLSKSEDKDVRLTTFIEREGEFTISADAGFPNRIWRSLEEVNAVSKIDFQKKYTLFNNSSTLKFGALYSYKQRDYTINSYDIGFRGVNPIDLNGDPDAILTPDNIWTVESNSGYYLRGSFQPANTFDAIQSTAAVYLSNEFRFSENFRTIIGVRAEQFTSLFTGEGRQDGQTLQFDNDELLNELDFIPSANLIYEVMPNSNIRLSYSKTTARPSFKEKSLVQIVDLLTGITFLGNIDLKPSYIDNFDLRYEAFNDNAQMFAISGFYKHFKNPIEIVAFSNIAPNNFTPRNAPSADVIGVEFEARKNFQFIAENLKNLSINLNVSLIDSKIEMNKGEGEEYESRLNFAREGEKIDDTRALQGQSPFLINTSLLYNNEDLGIETGLFYNVQGKTLDVVGFGKNPDVFIQPFNSLNFNFSKTIGPEKKASMTLKVDNILNDTRESLYESFNASDKPFEYRAPGTSFSLGYSLTF